MTATAGMKRRPYSLCRSWLFLPGAETELLMSAPESGADVLIQELEDFTPHDRLDEARALASSLYDHWRISGAIAAVRVNPLDQGGGEDLDAVMDGRPDLVALPKVAEAADIAALDRAIGRMEQAKGIPIGTTAILPNVEYARGLVNTVPVVEASGRSVACLMASEDLAADLGAERGQDGLELAYCRQRFIVECTAARTVAIDCPYTWSDSEGVERDTLWARRLGYRAKSAVSPAHAGVINRVLTPSEADVARARRIVEAFETARARGAGRAEVDGSLVEMPIYMTARRLIERAEALEAAAASVGKR